MGHDQQGRWVGQYRSKRSQRGDDQKTTDRAPMHEPRPGQEQVVEAARRPKSLAGGQRSLRTAPPGFVPQKQTASTFPITDIVAVVELGQIQLPAAQGCCHQRQENARDDVSSYGKASTLGSEWADGTSAVIVTMEHRRLANGAAQRGTGYRDFRSSSFFLRVT